MDIKISFNNFPIAILALNRVAKRLVIITLDVFLCALTIWLAFYLRLDDFLSITAILLLWFGLFVLIAIPIFIRASLYRAIFRYSDFPAILTMVRSMLLYGFLFASVFTFYGVPGVPRTVGLIQPMLLLKIVFNAATRNLAHHCACFAQGHDRANGSG